MIKVHITIALAVVLGAIQFASFGVQAAEVATPVRLPASVYELFSEAPLSDKYLLVSRIQPSYLQGDFNGDAHGDTAALVKQRKTDKLGIAIVHGGSRTVTVLGAGSPFGSGGDDFSWMDAWRVYPKGHVEQGAEEDMPPTPTGDGILVIKTGSASALVYWNGTQYVWYQQGD